ncbi:MAG TPA: sulfatase-like hydrolase/transferase [Acidimicrobiales bacterium]
MGRKILFITTDQQRYDSLGCNGGTIARTPVIDGLAAAGLRYERAYNQNTVCMPARSTMLTGQYVRTHGVVANGVPLPLDAPSIAAHLAEHAGYRTALLGKAHFEPGFDLHRRWAENRRAAEGDTGPWRGFETSIQTMHVPAVGDVLLAHYGRWLAEHGPEYLHTFAPLLGGSPGGDTGAPETAINTIPRELYHTDWVADLTVSWLDSLDPDDDWFCWMSFPDPHHPWDPPAGELGRVPWRDLDLPPGHPGSDEACREVLAQKPAHWLAWYEGRFQNIEGGPAAFVPAQMTHDQVREVNAKTHVMNELIDEAVGRVMATVAARGWDQDTDVFFTTDHGELQGDYGLLFKGPYHTDALMRLPLVWRPAPSAQVSPAAIAEPVGQLDLAPTFCAIAGLPVPAWAEGVPLPQAPGSARQRVLCEWDSQFPGVGMHLRSIYRDGWLCTSYLPSTGGQPNGLEQVLGESILTPIGIQYDGTEGELYRIDEDPHAFRNLWDDPSHRHVRDDLLADLRDSLPPARAEPLLVEAPA